MTTGTRPAAGALAGYGVAAVVVGLGAAGVVLSLGLGTGTLSDPAAGTWPLFVSSVLTVLGLALALTARSTNDAERFVPASLKVLAGLGTLLVFALLVGTVGFEIPALVLAFVWLRFLGRESWRVSIVGSLAMVVSFYVVFVVALRVTIPHLF